MKRCARCGAEKPVDEFRVKNPRTGLRTSYCIPCIRANSKEHYEANKATYVAKARKNRESLRARNVALLVEYLQAHPCVDCGETDVQVLDFDHLRDKEFAIGHAIADRNWSELLQEIAKCEVACANCHRRRTARRAGFLRMLLAEGL